MHPVQSFSVPFNYLEFTDQEVTDLLDIFSERNSLENGTLCRKKRNIKCLSTKKFCTASDCLSKKNGEYAVKLQKLYDVKNSPICRRCYDSQRTEKYLKGLSGMLCTNLGCLSEKNTDGTATKTKHWHGVKGKKICDQCYKTGKKIDP